MALIVGGRYKTLLVYLLLVLQCVPITSSSTREEEVELYDVLAYGANAAGVAAAVTATNNGRYRVKVVEPLTMIGGMVAAGGVALMN
jgi:ribulose 1,5-bisphosphate synthetase/thiazole synthase